MNPRKIAHEILELKKTTDAMNGRVAKDSDLQLLAYLVIEQYEALKAAMKVMQKHRTNGSPSAGAWLDQYSQLCEGEE